MTKESVDEKKIGDYLIRIIPDDNAESPREDCNIGKMVCFHRRYSLGDKHSYDVNDFNSWAELEKMVRKGEKAVVVLPLYLYDHSGITMNTTGFSCPWDSGRVGIIYVTRQTAKEEMGMNRMTAKNVEKLKRILKAEVATYDQYLTGDIYGFDIVKVDEKGNEEDIDSCWGFYGQDECMKEAEGIVNYHIEHETVNG